MNGAENTHNAPEKAIIPSNFTVNINQQEEMKDVENIHSASEKEVARDIDPNGPCKAEISRGICTMESGVGAVAKCLRLYFLSGEWPAPVSYECFHEANLLLNKPTEHHADMMLHWAACEVDIVKHQCAPEDPLEKLKKGDQIVDPEEEKGSGKVKSLKSPSKQGLQLFLPCLRANRDTLTDDCSALVFDQIMSEAHDVAADDELTEACQEDLSALCSEPFEENNSADTIACLMSNRVKLRPSCLPILFRREMERGEDVRLHSGLWRSCSEELENFCKAGPYGNARKIDCLWKYHSEDQFSNTCKDKIIAQIVAQEKDYRLDYRLRKACEESIHDLCGKQKALQDRKYITSDSVQHCLKFNFFKIKEPECTKEIKRIVAIQNTLWLADANISAHCTDDVNTFCSGYSSEQVNGCLRDHYRELKPACREAEFIDLQVEAADINMKPTLKRNCKKSIQRLCSDVEAGESRILECLEDNLVHGEMDDACRIAVIKNANVEAKDWHLKYGIAHSCGRIMNRLCKDEMKQPDSGVKVTECLMTHKSEIKDLMCKAAVTRSQRLRVEDMASDPNMVEACEQDIESHCQDIHNEQALGNDQNMHACLQNHLEQLSPKCKEYEEEVQLEMILDIDVNVQIKTACYETIQTHCKDVPNEGGAILSCLQDKIEGPELSEFCRKRLEEQMMRNDYRGLCKSDVARLCRRHQSLTEEETLSCLRQKLSLIRKNGCKKAVLRAKSQRKPENDGEKNALHDLPQSCQIDVKRFCSVILQTGKGGEQQLNSCLWKNYWKLSPECIEAKFDEELSEEQKVKQLQMHCRSEKRTHCKTADWDMYDDVLECLAKKRKQRRFSLSCSQAIQQLSLNSEVNAVAMVDMYKECRPVLNHFKKQKRCQKGHLAEASHDYQTACLIQNLERINSANCRSAVYKVQKHHIMKYGAKPGLAEDCDEDAENLCPSEVDERIRCLEDNIDSMESWSCQQQIRKILEIRLSSIMFNPELSKSCTEDIKEHCQGLNVENADMLNCLFSVQKSLEGQCLMEVERLQTLSLSTVKVHPDSWIAEFKISNWAALLVLFSLGFVMVMVLRKHLFSRCFDSGPRIIYSK